MPPAINTSKDCLAWKWRDKDGFSSSMIYKTLFSYSIEESTHWKKIWRAKEPQRVRAFLWLLWHGKILINSERRRRHMMKNDMCLVCGIGLETINHAMRDCTFTSSIWRRVVPRQVSSSFFSLPFHEWILWNLNDNGKLGRGDME